MSPSPQNLRRGIFLTAGFAMFSMFFGSGNLVFPLVIGQITKDQSSYAIWGLIVTGTLVPFLGLLTMIFVDGNAKRFFTKLGKIPGFLLPFFLLAILGPFGVCARCILVSYGSLELVFPHLPFSVFTVTFSALAALLTLNRNKIVGILGKYLTPFLLFGIISILVVGLWLAPPMDTAPHTPLEAFNVGLHQGYQTMDLLAAFFFSISIVAYLRAHMGHDAPVEKVAREAIKASAVGITLLAFVYLGFVTLGASFSGKLCDVCPEHMLVQIAQHTLGDAALPIVALTITMACLTTLIALAGLFADFCETEIFAKRVARSHLVIVTYALCCLVSFLGFESLARVMGSLLEYLYPALIVLSLASILDYYTKKNWAPRAFYYALILVVVLKLLNEHVF
ncbi:MAG: branched-chain amino acid transport system II carrier protein [Proteobacteria bacterium]|nr:branched-chain amino acid transport system II carrier protein [Pseudomonadota bacterium]